MSGVNTQSAESALLIEERWSWISVRTPWTVENWYSSLSALGMLLIYDSKLFVALSGVKSLMSSHKTRVI